MINHAPRTTLAIPDPESSGLAAGSRLGRHPGPPDPERIQTVVGEALHLELELELEAGQNLRQAITLPLRAAGLDCATVRIENLRVNGLRYVRPAPASDGRHAAFYSETCEMPGPVEIRLATATVGVRDDLPFVHCHAVWNDAGIEHGGHLFCEHVLLASDARASAWGLSNTVMQADHDPETDFTLFHPVPRVIQSSSRDASRPRMVVARIRPNMDLLTSIETLCRRHRVSRAVVRGSVGSIVGARFDDGRTVDDIATETVVDHGSVETVDGDTRAALEIALIDPSGRVHRGSLQRHANPVLICVELFVQEVMDPPPLSPSAQESE